MAILLTGWLVVCANRKNLLQYKLSFLINLAFPQMLFRISVAVRACFGFVPVSYPRPPIVGLAYTLAHGSSFSYRLGDVREWKANSLQYASSLMDLRVTTYACTRSQRRCSRNGKPLTTYPNRYTCRFYKSGTGCSIRLYSPAGRKQLRCFRSHICELLPRCV